MNVWQATTTGKDSWVWVDTTTPKNGKAHARGPRLVTTIVSFGHLTEELLALETAYGHSTLDVVRAFVRGDIEHAVGSELDRWITAFLLWLGTSELRPYT